MKVGGELSFSCLRESCAQSQLITTVKGCSVIGKCHLCNDALSKISVLLQELPNVIITVNSHFNLTFHGSGQLHRTSIDIGLDLITPFSFPKNGLTSALAVGIGEWYSTKIE